MDRGIKCRQIDHISVRVIRLLVGIDKLIFSVHMQNFEAITLKHVALRRAIYEYIIISSFYKNKTKMHKLSCLLQTLCCFYSGTQH